MNMERISVQLIKPGKEKEISAKLPKSEVSTLDSGTMVRQTVQLIKHGKEKEIYAKLPKSEVSTLDSGVNQLMRISVKAVKLTKVE
jgi:hypothetical protein